MRWLVNTFSFNMLRNGTGRLDVRPISGDEARRLAESARAAVAHPDVAAVLGSVLGLQVPSDRTSVGLQPGDELLVGQIHGPRLPAGATRLPSGGSVAWCHVRVGSGSVEVAVEEPVDAASSPGAGALTPPRGEGLPSATTVNSGQTLAPPDAVRQVASLPVAVAPPVEQAPTAPVDRRTRDEILEAMAKRSWWRETDALARERRALLALDPTAGPDGDAAEAEGRERARAFAKLSDVAKRSGPDSDAFAALAREIIARWAWARAEVNKTYTFFTAKLRNSHRNAQLAAEGRPLTSVRGDADRRVLALAPDPSWTLLVDESGTNFSRPGDKGREGRFVGVLVPSRVRLPALPAGFHSAKESDATLDRHMQVLLDADVGVLGVTLRDLPPTPGERWVDGVLELVDWALLLLPRATGQPVELDVRVEARGVFVAGQDWEVAARDLLRRHAAREPGSVAHLGLGIHSYGKTQEPLLGYADLVAFTWNAGTDASAARLRASGLQGRCLIEGRAPALRALWDGFTRDRSPSPGAWSTLVQDPAADDPLSIPGLLASRLADRARDDAGLWESYLAAAIGHLDSKAVDLSRLGRELGWLAGAAPADTTLPPAARHAWALARLAEANHLGATVADADAEVASLGALLFEERAPAVCHGDLHRAVLATNRFDFDAASRALARWEGVEPATPGLQMWGRVQSSLGQHLAFSGRSVEAVGRFDTALAAFERLSDSRVRHGEALQTATYRAVAIMDDLAATDAASRAAVEVVLGPIPAAIARLGPSSSVGDRYALHLLLRWAVHRGDPESRSAVRAGAARWTGGRGHPWPLIFLYRALLLHEAPQMGDPRPWLRRGVAAAWQPEQGPTVAFIGLVLAVVLAGKGERDSRIPAALELVRTELPAAAARIDRVAQELDCPGDVLVLLREVLPFNFR